MREKCEEHNINLKKSKYHHKYCPKCQMRSSDTQQAEEVARKFRGKHF